MGHIQIRRIQIGGIPALIWGQDSDRLYVHVHGKMSRKEFAEDFAMIAQEKGYQTLSFDLPEHGERSGTHEYPCDIWNGPKDLKAIAEYAFAHWKAVSLYAGSLGAFFSLYAYRKRSFQKCLFQSPIVDMDFLVRRMMDTFGVTEAEFQEKKVIPNPIDPLRWDYYQFVKENPITEWSIPTAILYGGNDWFQSEEVIRHFAEAYGCDLTIVPGREHAFMAEGDSQLVKDWYRDKI